MSNSRALPDLTWSGQRQRPEFSLILSCARTQLDSTTTARIWTLLQNSLDWDLVLAVARRHGVMPLLYRHVSAQGETCHGCVPDSVLEKLRAQFVANSQRNLFLTTTLLRLLDLFKHHDIPVMPLKGPVLAKMVYGDISLRQFADLDIFVREADVLRIHDLLNDEKFISVPALTQMERRVQRRMSSEYGYHSETGTVRLEIHENLSPPSLPGRQTLDAIWDDLLSHPFYNTTVPVLAPEDLLLYLSGHGTKHVWERLEWICCIAEILRQQMVTDWDAVWERARQRRLTRSVMIALSLADSVLQAPLPTREAVRVRADTTVQRLAATARRGLFARNGEPVSSFEFVCYALRVDETPLAKLRSCTFRMFTPTVADLSFLPLPQVLHPLYKVVRPIRLAWTYGRPTLRALVS